MSQTENDDHRPESGADWALVERVMAGDDAAFDQVMARYKGPVLNFIFRMLGNATEAEDVAQDVFIRAYRALQKRAIRRGAGAFSTWLFQVARNASLDRIRSRKRHPTEPLIAHGEGRHDPVGPGSPPDAAMMASEAGQQVADAVAQLPEEQRVALVLSSYNDCSHEEIAAVMKCTRKSVETRIYRARQFLRKQLAHLLSK